MASWRSGYVIVDWSAQEQRLYYDLECLTKQLGWKHDNTRTNSDEKIHVAWRSSMSVNKRVIASQSYYGCSVLWTFSYSWTFLVEKRLPVLFPNINIEPKSTGKLWVFVVYTNTFGKTVFRVGKLRQGISTDNIYPIFRFFRCDKQFQPFFCVDLLLFERLILSLVYKTNGKPLHRIGNCFLFIFDIIGQHTCTLYDHHICPYLYIKMYMWMHLCIYTFRCVKRLYITQKYI